MVAQDQLRFSSASIRLKFKDKLCVYKKPEVGTQDSTSGVRNIDIVDSLFK